MYDPANSTFLIQEKRMLPEPMAGAGAAPVAAEAVFFLSSPQAARNGAATKRPEASMPPRSRARRSSGEVTGAPFKWSLLGRSNDVRYRLLRREACQIS